VKEKSIAAMNKYGLQSVVAPEKVEASCSIIMHQRIMHHQLIHPQIFYEMWGRMNMII
jgi:hypothetical protein